MIERRHITLEDKDLLRNYIQKDDNSTYNYTTMYLWSQDGSITYAEVCGCLVVFYQFGKGPITASFPVGNGDVKAAVETVSAYLRENKLNPVFRNLDDGKVEMMKALFPGRFEYIYDRNNSDYLYETEKMITHAGKKLHQKRNHLNYFLKTYQYEYIELTHDDMEECRTLFDRWIDEKEALHWIGDSREATYRLLDHFDYLGVRGGGIKIDGELIAFSIGEPVTDNTALIHIEFGDPTIRGAFNIINQQFCEHAWSAYQYVNREEDMGLPGLRQAKLAYRPVRILDKYNAVAI